MSIHIIGAGRLASALCRTFREQVATVISRRESEAREVALLAGPNTDSGSRFDAACLEEGDTVWLAVPDDQIEPVSALLADSSLPGNLLCIHSAGALGLSALSPLEAKTSTAALHPNLVVLGDKSLPVSALWGSTFAASLTERIARLLRPIDPRLLTIDEAVRVDYHLAATFAANYPVLLASIAFRLYERAAVSSEESHELVSGYLQSVIGSISASERPIKKITGPAKRKDVTTLRAHLTAIESLDGESGRLLLEALIDGVQRESEGGSDDEPGR